MKLREIFRKIVDCTLNIINAPIKHSKWFNSLFVAEDGELYPNNRWYREHYERNFDIVVLGSSSAKWGFDFTSFDIKGMNWAQAPQTLVEDYNILRNFHSILRKDGYVVITIMPFTSLNKETNIYDALKYLKISTHKPIESHMLNKAYRYFKYPIFMGKPAIKAGIRHILRKEPSTNTQWQTITTNPMSPQQLEHNAQNYINGWKKQFEITDFEAPLSIKNKEGRAFRTKIMQEIIDFCLEREYKPILVIPPTTSYLSNFFTKDFEELYIYSFIKEIGRDIPLLDYSKKEDLKDEQLYLNALILNQSGRVLLTKNLLKDLHMIK